MIEGAGGDAELVEDTELAEGGFGFVLARKEAGIFGEEGMGFIFILAEEFEAEVY